MDVVSKVARLGLVPHSNHASVARPFGFTLPLSVAPVVPTPVAASVVTVGTAPGVVDPPQEDSRDIRIIESKG
jgi:hypothetical protein